MGSNRQAVRGPPRTAAKSWREIQVLLTADPESHANFRVARSARLGLHSRWASAKHELALSV